MFFLLVSVSINSRECFTWLPLLGKLHLPALAHTPGIVRHLFW